MKIIYMFILSILLTSEVFAMSNNANSTVLIKKMSENGMIALSDGRTVSLAGLKAGSLSLENVSQITKLLRNKKAVFQPDSVNPTNGYLFVFGLSREAKPYVDCQYIYRGFLDAKSGADTLKGLAVNLNILLLLQKKAELDTTSNCDMKEVFQACVESL